MIDDGHKKEGEDGQLRVNYVVDARGVLRVVERSSTQIENTEDEWI